SLSFICFFFFSSRRRHTRSKRDWSSDVCSSDLMEDDISSLLAELGIHDIAAWDKVRTLSVAQQQVVEIVKAMSFDARLISMDERSEERRVGKECRSRGVGVEERKKAMSVR